MRHGRTVAVDFDGVLHTYRSGWTGYAPADEPEPGALEFVNHLLALGYEVVVMSSRAHCEEGVGAVERWLEQHGFPPLRVTCEKVLAVAYVDDRAVPYVTGSNAWLPLVDRIHVLANRATQTDN